MKNDKEKEIWLNSDELRQLLEGGLYWKDIEPKLSEENAESIRRQISLEDDTDINDTTTSAYDQNTGEFDQNKGEYDRTAGKFPEEDQAKAGSVFAGDSDEDNEELRTILLGEQNLAQDELQRLFISQAASLEDDFNGLESMGSFKSDQSMSDNLDDVTETSNPSETDDVSEANGTGYLSEMDNSVETSSNRFSQLTEDFKDTDAADGSNKANASYNIEDVTMIPKSPSERNVLEETEVGAEERNRFSDLNHYIMKSKNNGSLDDDDDMDINFEQKSGFGGLKLVILVLIFATVTFGLWYFLISS